MEPHGAAENSLRNAGINSAESIIVFNSLTFLGIYVHGISLQDCDDIFLMNV